MFPEVLRKIEPHYCILHGWQGLPEELPSDLDIVVAPESLPDLEKELLNARSGKLVQLLQHESSCYYFVLAVENENCLKFIPIDTATDYRRDGRVFFTAEELLAGRRAWNGFWVASPQVEFGYLLVKKVLKADFPEHQKKRFKELLEELGGEAEQIADRFFGNRWGREVIGWIRTEDWQALEKRLPRVRRVLLWRKVRQDPLNPLRYWIPEMGRILRRWRHPTGLVVVVLGPDGAGKSTLVDNLQEQLQGPFRRTAVLHFKPRLFGKKGPGAPVTDPHGKPPRSLPASIAKLAYYLASYLLGYWLRIRPLLVKSTLVLFDRYYDDLLVDPRRYRYGAPMWLAHFVQRRIQRPDLFLILDVPEQQLVARKREVPWEELGRQREAYRRLAEALPNAILVDGSLPAEAVAQNAREIVLDFLHERYLKRRKIWFGKEAPALDWLFSVLNVKPGRSQGIPFGKLLLPDGRGYLVPLSHSRKVAARSLSIYSAQGTKAKLAKGVLEAGFCLGVCRWLLPKVELDVLGNGGQDPSLLAFLQNLFGRSDLAFAISLGTPGPHRKPTIQVLAPDGQILGYAKVGWNENTRCLIENERKALEIFNNSLFRYSAFPKVLYYGEWNGKLLLITNPLDIQSGQRNPFQLTKLHIQCLEEIARFDIIRERFGQSEFWQSIKKRIENLRDAIPSYQTHVLEYASELLGKHLGSLTIPWVWRVGDFTPWNTKADERSKKVSTIDLEYATRKWLPGWDLFHFLACPHRNFVLEKARLYSKYYHLVKIYFSSLSIEEALIPSLHVGYLVDLWTSWYQTWHESKRPLPPKEIKWFREMIHHIMASYVSGGIKR